MGKNDGACGGVAPAPWVLKALLRRGVMED